jgi:hypothetical protein
MLKSNFDWAKCATPKSSITKLLQFIKLSYIFSTVVYRTHSDSAIKYSGSKLHPALANITEPTPSLPRNSLIMKYPSQSSNPDRITLINSLVYQQRPTGTSNLEDPHPCSTASPRTPPPTPESQARTRLNIIIKSAFAAIEDDDPFGNGDSFKDGMDCHSDDRNQPSLQ